MPPPRNNAVIAWNTDGRLFAGRLRRRRILQVASFVKVPIYAGWQEMVRNYDQRWGLGKLIVLSLPVTKGLGWMSKEVAARGAGPRPGVRSRRGGGH